MLVTNHVLSGAVLGALLPSPVAAFGVGVASHFLLDALPHWGVTDREAFLDVAVRDGLTGLGALALLATLAAPDRRATVLFGMAGAALPDLDKPALLFFGRSPFPRVVDSFHQAIQREAAHRMPHELAVGVLTAALATVLVRRRRAAPER